MNEEDEEGGEDRDRPGVNMDEEDAIIQAVVDGHQTEVRAQVSAAEEKEVRRDEGVEEDDISSEPV